MWTSKVEMLPLLHNHAAQTPVFILEDVSLATLLLYNIVDINYRIYMEVNSISLIYYLY